MYEKRLVAFLDILGFKEITYKAVGNDGDSIALQQKIYAAILEIREFFLRNNADAFLDIQITQG